MAGLERYDPATAQAIQDMIETTFEPELVAMVKGDAQTAEVLTHLPFDHILFTAAPLWGAKLWRRPAAT